MTLNNTAKEPEIQDGAYVCQECGILTGSLTAVIHPTKGDMWVCLRCVVFEHLPEKYPRKNKYAGWFTNLEERLAKEGRKAHKTKV